MIQIVVKAVITLIFGAVFLAAMRTVWTSEIDVYRTLIRPIAFLLPATRGHGSIEIDYANVLAARIPPEGDASVGNIALFFYDAIRFINSTDKNVVVKSVHLRYQLDNAPYEVNSYYVNTGRVSTVHGALDAIIIHGTGDIVIMRWKNIRQELADEKSLSPGAVLGAGAAFVLGVRKSRILQEYETLSL